MNYSHFEPEPVLTTAEQIARIWSLIIPTASETHGFIYFFIFLDKQVWKWKIERENFLKL